MNKNTTIEIVSKILIKVIEDIAIVLVESNDKKKIE